MVSDIGKSVLPQVFQFYYFIVDISWLLYYKTEQCVDGGFHFVRLEALIVCYPDIGITRPTLQLIDVMFHAGKRRGELLHIIYIYIYIYHGGV